MADNKKRQETADDPVKLTIEVKRGQKDFIEAVAVATGKSVGDFVVQRIRKSGYTRF